MQPNRPNTGDDQLDLVNSFTAGRIDRRDFVKRGLVVGLSLPALSAIIAACGSDDDASGGTDTTAVATEEAPADTTGGSAEEAPTTEGSEAPTTEAAASGGSGLKVMKVASQKPAGPVDPVAMQDLGNYGLIAQCFEYLCALGDSDIAPGLAESWTPNADGSVWTFNLRQGVKWQDGKDFTSADVAGTFDRLVEAGNSGLKGVIEAGSVDSTDPAKAVVKLVSGNGNFPYLVSVYNPQACITPADYALGSTLDAKPNGTGPFKLESFDAATGAKFVRNDGWWGGAAPLESTEWIFFEDIAAQVNAAAADEVDALVQFSIIGGDALLNKADFNVLGMRAATHRQIWMRCDKGPFKDKKVRQALALSIDRDKLVETLFKGKADVGNDHVIAPIYPYFDASTPQRVRDIEKAKALLKEAGVTAPFKAQLHVGQLQEIPDLAQLIAADVAEAGFELEIVAESLDTFYGAQWCPESPADPPCSGAADLGIVDYGHRATPDVYLNAALKTGGVWASSQYSSPAFDAAFAEFQAAVGLDAQKTAATKIQTILNDEVPVIVPYFYNYISGHSKKFTGVRLSALGQLFLDKAVSA
jgi:peptide/nickel transport system substrate-binding protein